MAESLNHNYNNNKFEHINPDDVDNVLYPPFDRDAAEAARREVIDRRETDLDKARYMAEAGKKDEELAALMKKHAEEQSHPGDKEDFLMYADDIRKDATVIEEAAGKKYDEEIVAKRNDGMNWKKSA